MIDYGVNQVEMQLYDPGVKDWPAAPGLAQGVDYGKAADTRRLYQACVDLGCEWIRIQTYWPNIEPSRGQYNWLDLDRALLLAKEFGLKVLLILGVHRPGAVVIIPGLFQSAGWVTATDFAALSRKVTERYGPNGFDCIAAYEIWNEENHAGFWGAGSPDPVAFTEYLKASATAIREHDPDPEIVIGGFMPIGDSSFSMDPLPFYKGIIKAGGKDFFTVVGNHPYTISYGFEDEVPTNNATFIKVDDAIRAQMVADGIGDRKIWWTEIGFASPHRMSELQKRNWLELQINLFLERPHVERFFIYNLRDSGADTTNEAFTYGIITHGWAPKNPTHDYVESINPDAAEGAASGSGSVTTTLGLGGKTLGNGVATARIAATATAAASGVGTAVGELYGRPMADTTGSGTATATAVLGVTRDGASTGSGTATATATTVVERAGAATGTGTASASASQQRAFSYNPASSPGVEPTGLFTAFGHGYDQPSSQLECPPAPTEGYHWSGGIYKTAHLSPNHWSEVTFGVGAGSQLSGERSVLPVVRSNAAGTEWVSVQSHWGGANALQLITRIAGVTEVRASFTYQALADGDRLGVIADGNTYTVYVIEANTADVIMFPPWTDSAGVFPGAANLYSGFGWQHVRSGGLPYGGPPISFWRASDVRPTFSMPQLVAAIAGAGAVLALAGANQPAAAAGSGEATATAVAHTSAAAAPGGTGTAAMTGIGITAEASGNGAVIADVGDTEASRDADTTGTGDTTVAVGGSSSGGGSASGSVASIIAAGVAAVATGVGAVVSLIGGGIAAAATGVGAVTTALKKSFSHTWSGTSEGPFGEWGDGFQVASGVATATAHSPLTNGTYHSGGRHNVELGTNEHTATVTFSNNGTSYQAPRGDGVCVGSDATSTNLVFCIGAGFGGTAGTDTAPTVIYTKIGSTITRRADASTQWIANEVMKMRVRKNGNDWVYEVFKGASSSTVLCSWTDTNGATFGTPGKFAGPAWGNVVSGGLNFGSGGLVAFTATDN